jgi:hypothetical protein
MKIDHMDVRAAVGAAAKRIAVAEEAYLDDKNGERTRLHKRWRDLVDAADAARKEYERCMQGIHAAASAADKAIIAEAKRKHPDLLIYNEHPDRSPVLCDATGLALFEGDELYDTAAIPNMGQSYSRQPWSSLFRRSMRLAEKPSRIEEPKDGTRGVGRAGCERSCESAAGSSEAGQTGVAAQLMERLRVTNCDIKIRSLATGAQKVAPGRGALDGSQKTAVTGKGGRP